MTLWWLSFYDPKRPEGTRFLGAVIVQAYSFLEAVCRAHKLDINPGGEALGIDFPSEFIIPTKWINRLLTRPECEQFDAEIADAQPKELN